MKKLRKPRTSPKHVWVCKHCGAAACDPMNLMDTPAGRKIMKRLELGLCIGCGHKPCTCKSREA